MIKHAEARDLWGCATEVNRLAEAAKSGTATREELSGSTITITSLGAMGGIVTTPVINYPEVAIVGVNKMMVRPMWDGAQFVPRKIMNLSSSSTIASSTAGTRRCSFSGSKRCWKRRR